MNGRVYDPELGRFLSPDPLIQAPYNSQSYNRYSYVFNNPLSFIDPSGYSSECPDEKYCEGTLTEASRQQLLEDRQRAAAQQANAAYYAAVEARGNWVQSVLNSNTFINTDYFYDNALGAAPQINPLSVAWESGVGVAHEGGPLFNDPAELAKGFVAGGWSLVGTGRAIRFAGRGTGLLGSNEYSHFVLEGEIVDEGLKLYFTNKSVRDQVNRLIQDRIRNTDNPSYTKGFVAGRMALGLAGAPLGALAIIGDVTATVERNVERGTMGYEAAADAGAAILTGATH